jgi:hypothetical protein
MLGDVDPATAEHSVDFPHLGNERAAFADVLADTAFEIVDFARVFAVLQGVLVSQRRATTRFGGSRDRGWSGGTRKI